MLICNTPVKAFQMARQKFLIMAFTFYPRAQVSRVIGVRAKRARRYLVLFMETRDIT